MEVGDRPLGSNNYQQNQMQQSQQNYNQQQNFNNQQNYIPQNTNRNNTPSNNSNGIFIGVIIALGVLVMILFMSFSSVKDKAEKLSADNKQLKEQNQQLEDDNKALEDDNKDLYDKISKLDKKVNDLKSNNESLQKKVNELSKELSNNNNKQTDDTEYSENDDETNNNISTKLDVHKENGITYASADAIVSIYHNNIDGYDLSGPVVVTGKVKSYSISAGITQIPTGQGLMQSTTDDLYMDDVLLSSTIGIKVDIDSGLDTTKYISDEAYNMVQGYTQFIPTKFHVWIEEQKKQGHWNENNQHIRVYGTGYEGVFTYSIEDCKKVEILDSNNNVVATWESDR